MAKKKEDLRLQSVFAFIVSFCCWIDIHNKQQ